MTIDFSTIEQCVIPAFKGGEKELAVKMFNDDAVRIMKGRLVPGASIGMHTHDTGFEVIFITKGTGCAVYDGQRIALGTGDVHYCPKGHTHSIINDSGSDLEFSAVVAQQ